MKLNIGDKVMVKARNDDPWWDLVAPDYKEEYVEATVTSEVKFTSGWDCDVVDLDGPDCNQTVPVSAIKPIKKPLQLKDGKKYETADGVVFKVRSYLTIFDVSDDTTEHWDENGVGFYSHPDLIRRHYTKPQPAHKLDLKKGDVVELVKWEDGSTECVGAGETFHVGKKGIKSDDWDFNQPKGERPLFKVVSRA